MTDTDPTPDQPGGRSHDEIRTDLAGVYDGEALGRLARAIAVRSYDRLG